MGSEAEVIFSLTPCIVKENLCAAKMAFIHLMSEGYSQALLITELTQSTSTCHSSEATSQRYK